MHQLQHKYGYDLYRVSIHVGREIFDWRGINVNKHMVPERRGLASMFGVRNMRKLEKVLPSTEIHQVGQLFRFGTSFLLTRERLAQKAVHHPLDLMQLHLSMADLNVENPSV